VTTGPACTIHATGARTDGTDVLVDLDGILLVDLANPAGFTITGGVVTNATCSNGDNFIHVSTDLLDTTGATVAYDGSGAFTDVCPFSLLVV
jgi:hypothetical protein